MKITTSAPREDATGFTFDVRVEEGGGESRHTVTLARKDFDRLASGAEDPAAFVSRCFEFLLAREAKESILSRFDVSVIGRYFPEFEKTIRATKS
ncbi:MAG TPA: hypothetical protein VIF62_18445 [Labilithrix sp.]|jgi:hypothetical protein